MVFPVVENVLTQIHIQLGPSREFVIWLLKCIFITKKYFTDYRVTQQETPFAGTTRRNLRLQTKTPKKNMSIWSARLRVKLVSKLMS